MNILENVVSGLFVALTVWGTRRARLAWRQRRIARAAAHDTAGR
ncbi:hypothetical protein OG906_42480 (plasmid) [Streptomyces sp. NBC_01426]|nr:hypothetical protein [Streptomyces sp. NBC_01426]